MSLLKIKTIALLTSSLLGAQGSAWAYAEADGIPLVRPDASPNQEYQLDDRGAVFSNGAEEGCCSAALAEDFSLTLRVVSDRLEGEGAGPILMMPNLDTAGHTLNVRLEGGARHPESNWAFGAGLAVNPSNQPNVSIEASNGTMIFWGGRVYDTLEDYMETVELAVNADSRARAAIHSMGRPAEDVLVLGNTLVISDQSHISIGATEEEAARGANFTLGSRGALVVDNTLFYTLEDDGALLEGGESDGAMVLTPALRAQSGATLFFAKDSTVVIDNLYGDYSDIEDFPEEGIGDEVGEEVGLSESGALSEEEEPMLPRMLISMAENSRVEGAQNVTVVDITGEVPFEYRLRLEEGGWMIGQTAWEAEGPLAGPVNALAQRVFDGTASEPLRTLFMGTATSRSFSQQVLYSTLTAKALGTTDAMDALMADTARHAVRTALADEWSNPVSVEILGSKRRGRFAALDKLNDRISEGRRERRASGIALSAETRFGDWFTGARAAYEDADVDLSFEGLRDETGLKAESTVLAAGLWLGRRTSWGFVTADAAFSGGEDKLRDAAPQADTAYPLWIGSERIRRRAWSAGLTAAVLCQTESGWMPQAAAGLSAQYFMPAEYSIDGNGTPLWQVKEKRRLFGTATVSAGITKRWSDDELKDTVRLTLESGIRMRAGDLDITQTVSADGVSANVTTDDLERGDAFLSADVTGRWKSSVFGVRAWGTVGPSGTRSLRGDVHVTYEF